MGIFNIDDIEKTDYTTKFTCYDNMIKFETAYFSSLGDKPSLQQVANELTAKTGVQFTGSLPSYTVSKLDGFSCREILSYVASICGGNAIITRDGKFTIKSLVEVEKSIDGNNYFDYKREEVKYKIGKISCQVDENKVLSKGSLGTDSMELQFENPWITEGILNDIYNKLNGVSYLGYSMKWQGDLSLDPYDIINVTDKKGVVRKQPILSQKFTYTGGLTSEIGAKGETKNKNSFSSSGSTTNKVNRLVTEQAIIKEALIEKANISDLKATNAEIENLKAKDAEIENALINKATIEELEAANANIEKLIAADAQINQALIGKADIIDLTATNIKFEVGSGGILDLQTLLSKFITGENGQFINISSDNVVIANATIKDAMIENISVNKINAGDISTNKFRIVSDNGGIEIVGATQQFKDKNNKVRIQMGQDTQGNFNFILRGEDGTTTLIDHTGIKEKAIADDLIKSNMVAADAIGEKQINYSSLITGLNKDTNTQLIKASKVAIDLEGQTLDVAFNSLKTNVDSKESRNLVLNSQPQNGMIFNSHGVITNKEFGEDEEVPSGKIGIITYKSEGINGAYITNSNWKPLIPGDTYTWSIYVKCSKEITIRLGVENGGVDNFVITSEWKKISKTFVANNIESKAFILYSKTNMLIGDTIYFSSLKIEEGENSNPVYSIAPEDIEEKIEANRTAITVAQGKIEGLIKETSITKGDVTTIKDNYALLKANVDGISTTVASHTSSIGNLTSDLTGVSGKITTVENKQATLEQNLNGFKQIVSETYSSKKELSEVDAKIEVTKNKVASIETNLNSITSRVSNVETTTTQINGTITQIDTRLKTAELKVTDSAIVSTVTSSSVYKNDLNEKVSSNHIISSINQTAETIKIDASKINLNGYVTMTNLSTPGATIIDGRNIRTGFIEAIQLIAPHVTGKSKMYLEVGSVFSSDGETNVKNFYGMRGGTFNVESEANFSSVVNAARFRVNGNYVPYSKSGYKWIIESLQGIGTGTGDAIEFQMVGGTKFGVDVWYIGKSTSRERCREVGINNGIDIINQLRHVDTDSTLKTSNNYLAYAENSIPYEFTYDITQGDGRIIRHVSPKLILPHITLAIQQLQQEIKEQQKIIEELTQKIEQLQLE